MWKFVQALVSSANGSRSSHIHRIRDTLILSKCRDNLPPDKVAQDLGWSIRQVNYSPPSRLKEGGG